MIRLTYFSTATGNMSGRDVQDILERSADTNRARGVTGMLAFNGRNFCQIIEGDEDAVHSLVEKIRTDKRHAGFKILDEKVIEQRHFDDWAFSSVDQLDFSDAMKAMNA
ncbi:BLUF domain-containing protein [Sulfitobacter sp. S190]|uniref:BLUF domain-containing protein n=1 Tax=Sulfitobacter sp. S190 TaxID=2867022 RepID=UPI0021A74ED6|nr:BLUF domain-containing protein [Sulfitobacter sp. S190]